MRFSREWINQLKSNIDLLDLIGEYTELQKAGPNLYIGRCPHPSHNDSDASFRVYTDKQTWACYGCHSDKKNKQEGNYGTDCIAFIEWINNISWIDAIKYLADKIDLPLPVEKHDEQLKTNYKLMKKYSKDLSENALSYLYSREITDKEIQQWNIGYDKYDNRIVFPLIDTYNNVIGFNKRLVSKQTKGISKKYIHSPDSEIFKKSNYLYGINQIDNNYNYLVITEGVFDVILARKYGLKNVICALGTALSENQLDIIIKQNKEVIVIYDSDTKGIATMKKVMPLLDSNNISAKLVNLPSGKDLADMAIFLKYDLEKYIFDNAICYSYYLIQNAINDFNKELFTLYDKYNIVFNTIKEDVPKLKLPIVESYIDNNIYNKELSIDALRQMPE